MVDYDESDRDELRKQSPDPNPETPGGSVATSKLTPSPAFQFYARHFLSSDKVSRMSLTEVGAFVLLLCHSWLNRGLPTDHTKIARYLKMPANRLERLWEGPLGECFIERRGRLVNPKQEEVRDELDAYRALQSAKGKMGGRPTKQSRGKAVGLPDESSTTTSTSEKRDVQKVEEGAFTFKTVGKPESWILTTGRIDEWQAAYPNLDVRSQCRMALAWLDANPIKRKTASGMPRFLVNWLNNATNRGAARVVPLQATGTMGRGRTGAPPAGKYDGIEEA